MISGTQTIQKIAGSGSNRQYIRQTDAEGRNVIRVVGTNHDENHAFLTMARHFEQAGLAVPHVLSVSEDEMEYVLQDLGDTLLFDYIADGRESGCFSEREQSMLSRTIRALAHVQVEGAKGLDWSVCYPVPTLDERSVRWDLNYFKYCFLKGTRIEFSEPHLEDEFNRLTSAILGAASPVETFLYRDFQSRNVMIYQNTPYFIDFQGGRRGPIYYDVASFLWQARANFPQSLREKLILDYVAELHSISDFRFDRSVLDEFVLFRTLQVLGAYGYRGYFERKQHFLQSIPAAIRNLYDLLCSAMGDRYPYLHRLADQLSATLSPSPSQSSSTSVPSSSDSPLQVTVYSFSFRRGIPEDASGNGGGYVFDCRSTHNPGRYDQYKQLTGLDQPVIDFLEQDGEILTFLDHAWKLVDQHVERFMQRGFTHLQVSFGCTGGQHRSVYSAEATAKHLHSKYGIHVHLIHRERGINRTL